MYLVIRGQEENVQTCRSWAGHENHSAGKGNNHHVKHHGHCINYWECEQSDTKWAEISLNQFEEEDGYYQATLPSNIASGTFVQSAADNADYLQGSVDGNQSVHVMAVYQGEFALNPKNLGFPAQNISKVRRRVLKSVETKLYELAFTSKTPVPTFIKQVKANFFQHCAFERERSYKE